MEKIEKYIGKNYNKISKNKFNFAAFFFGEFYLAYRKRFIEGLVLAIINVILSTTLSKISYLLYLMCLIIIRIVIGILFNKMYIKYCNKNIDKLDDKSTSVGLIFGLLGIEIVVSIIFSLVFGNNLLNQSNEDDYIDGEVDNLDDFLNEEDDGTYNGGITYKAINISDYFDIEVPSVFTDNLSSDNNYAYRYDYNESDGVFNSCEFSLIPSANYTDYETLPTQIYDYYKKDSTNIVEEVKEANNGLDWKYVSIDNDLGTTYMYVTKYKDTIFMFDYTVGEDTDDKCITYKDSVFNSIKAKN